MLLVSALSVNYARVEARFPVEDLLTCTARRALNLTEDWLLSVVSEEDWNNHYKDILASSLEDQERLEDQMERWGDPDEDGRGEFNLVRRDTEEVPSNFNFNSAKQ